MSLGRLVRTIGLLLGFASFAWWLFFFGKVARAVGSPDILGEASVCMLYTTAPCGIAYVAAELAGQLAYRPILTWFGLALYVFGLALSASRRAGMR
jgi:hypothetical protein